MDPNDIDADVIYKVLDLIQQVLLQSLITFSKDVQLFVFDDKNYDLFFDKLKFIGNRYRTHYTFLSFINSIEGNTTDQEIDLHWCSRSQWHLIINYDWAVIIYRSTFVR